MPPALGERIYPGCAAPFVPGVVVGIGDGAGVPAGTVRAEAGGVVYWIYPAARAAARVCEEDVCTSCSS
jgi:hypothetical protein